MPIPCWQSFVGPCGGIRLPLRERALNLHEPNYWVDKCDLLLKEGTDEHNLSELDREHGSCGHKLGSYIPENPELKMRMLTEMLRPQLGLIRTYDEDVDTVAAFKEFVEENDLYPMKQSWEDWDIGWDMWTWPVWPLTKQKPYNIEKFDEEIFLLFKGTHLPIGMFVGANDRSPSSAVGRSKGKEHIKDERKVPGHAVKKIKDTGKGSYRVKGYGKSTGGGQSSQSSTATPTNSHLYAGMRFDASSYASDRW